MKKSILSMILIISILLSVASAEDYNNEGLSLNVHGMYLHDTWHDDAEPYVKWLEVQIVITNWDTVSRSVENKVFGKLTFQGKYTFDADIEMSSDIIAPLFDIPGSLVFKLPSRVTEGKKDDFSLIIFLGDDQYDVDVDIGSISIEQTDDKVYEQGNSISSDIRFTEAENLINRGKYNEADLLLASLPSCERKTELLAMIDLAEAEKALSEGNNTLAEKTINRISEMALKGDLLQQYNKTKIEILLSQGKYYEVDIIYANNQTEYTIDLRKQLFYESRVLNCALLERESLIYPDSMVITEAICFDGGKRKDTQNSSHNKIVYEFNQPTILLHYRAKSRGGNDVDGFVRYTWDNGSYYGNTTVDTLTMDKETPSYIESLDDEEATEYYSKQTEIAIINMLLYKKCEMSLDNEQLHRVNRALSGTKGSTIEIIPNSDVIPLPTPEIIEVTPEPTATPNPPVAGDPDDNTVIDATSSEMNIRDIQRKLILLGILAEGEESGRYDDNTRTAVKQFQARVNDLQGYEALNVTGLMDAVSIAFLNYYVDEWNSSLAATVEPTLTAAPESKIYDPDSDPITVKKGSSVEAVRIVQSRLIAIGIMPAGADDGEYGESTANAVFAFQEWVNQQRNEQTVPVNGEADQLTRAYLKYCADNNLHPLGITTQMPGDSPGVPDTDAEIYSKIAFDFYQSGNYEQAALNYEQALSLVPNYNYASSAAMAYLLGGINDQAEKMLKKCIQLKPEAIEPYVYLLNLYPDQNNRPWDVAQLLKQGFQLTGDIRLEAAVNKDSFDKTSNADDHDSFNANTSLEIHVNGQKASDSVVEVGGDSFTVSWDVEGVMSSYDVYVSDSNGNAIISAEKTKNTNFKVDAARMNPGEVYTVTIGARLEGSDEDDVIWQTAKFMRPVEVTPEPLEAPVPDPPPTEGSVSEPSIIVDGKKTVDDVVSITEESFCISWDAEGSVQGYNVQITDANGNFITNQAGVQQTEVVVKASQMQPGMVYTISVGAVPVNGGVEDVVWSRGQFMIPATTTPEATSEPTPTPTEVPTSESEEEEPRPRESNEYDDPIDAETDADIVQRLQRRLYILGMMDGEPEQGVLDTITLQAVAEFQSRANEQYDAGLNIIDPGDPGAVVDVNTLKWIFDGQ